MTFEPMSAKANFLSTDLISSRYRLDEALDAIVVDIAYVEDFGIPADVRVGMEL